MSLTGLWAAPRPGPVPTLSLGRADHDDSIVLPNFWLLIAKIILPCL